MRRARAETDGDRLLQLIVLSLDGPDPMYFVIVRSSHTVKATVEYLRRKPAFRLDTSLANQVGPHLGALAQLSPARSGDLPRVGASHGRRPAASVAHLAAERSRHGESRRPDPDRRSSLYE